MTSSIFDSFDGSAFDVFIQSPSGDARNGVSGVVVLGATVMTIGPPLPTQSIFGTSWLDGNEIKIIGADDLSPGTAKDFLEYKGVLYMTSHGINVKTGNFGYYDEADGKWKRNNPANTLNGSGGDSLVLWNDLLVCVGPFSSITGLFFNDPWAKGGVAWDGTDWLTIGLDGSSIFPPGEPSNAISYNDLLIVSGANKIRYTADGTIGSWGKLFAGDTDSFGDHYAITHYDDKVAFAGYQFVMTWALDDTSYTSLGTPTGANTKINSMVEYEGDLIVGGSFTAIDGVPAENMARWDGTEWFAMGQGISSLGSAEVRYILVDEDGALLVGGHYTKDGDLNDLDAISIWNGAQFVNAADNYVGGTINAIGVYSGSFEL